MNTETILESETSLLPWLIADDVCREVESYGNVELPESYRQQLYDKAEAVYACHKTKRFGRQMRGNNAPAQLRVFMRHWLAGILHRERPALHRSLPRGFGNGQAI